MICLPDPLNDGLPVHCRAASAQDLVAIGRVYLRAFAQAPRELRSPNLAPQAIADVARACLLAEPDCITVAQVHAEHQQQIVGYVIAPCDSGKPAQVALGRGLLLVWIGRWITGRYGLSLGGGLALVSDKLRFRRPWRLPGTSCAAAVLSIAVDPAWQSQGTGRRLLGMAVGRRRELGCECVRLEMRPDNHVARRLYESLGFRRVSGFRDSRGWWEIMLLELRGERQP